MKIATCGNSVKICLILLTVTLAISGLTAPCFAQAPAVTFSQIMIPESFERCGPHLTQAFGEVGYAIEQSGNGWSMAVKARNRAIMVCGNGEGRNSTQLTIFVAGPDNIDEEKNRLQVEMQRRFRR